MGSWKLSGRSFPVPLLALQFGFRGLQSDFHEIAHGGGARRHCHRNRKLGALFPRAKLQEFHSMPARRFPPPWTVEELDACFVVTE